MPKKHQYKYDLGYKFFQYKIIEQYRYSRPNGGDNYGYKVECLDCGAIIFRHEQQIGKNIKCRQCLHLGKYSKFNKGDVVNNLEILDKKMKSKSNGGTYITYLCKCLTDGYISNHIESNLLKGKGCPVCTGNLILKGVNDISTKAPWMMSLLANKEDGYNCGIGSKKEDCV